MTAMTPKGGGGVAFAAHLGGFIAGAALIPLFKHRTIPLFGKRR
jgi:membrane associated rhomboid family serine protease